MENPDGKSDQPWRTIGAISHTSLKISELISDIVEFFPRNLSMPKMSSTDSDIHAAQYIIHTLKNPVLSRPIVTLENTHNEALISLAKIFDK